MTIDTKGIDDLKIHFENLGLPDHAKEWLLDLYFVFQGFDDIYDEEKLEKKDILKLVIFSLVKLQTNPFFMTNSYSILPVLSVAILKWAASNQFEEEKRVSPISFCARAAYYDVILHVFSIVFGSELASEKSAEILAFYGEKYENYLNEFGGP